MAGRRAAWTLPLLLAASGLIDPSLSHGHGALSASASALHRPPFVAAQRCDVETPCLRGCSVQGGTGFGRGCVPPASLVRLLRIRGGSESSGSEPEAETEEMVESVEEEEEKKVVDGDDDDDVEGSSDFLERDSSEEAVGREVQPRGRRRRRGVGAAADGEADVDVFDDGLETAEQVAESLASFREKQRKLARRLEEKARARLERAGAEAGEVPPSPRGANFTDERMPMPVKGSEQWWALKNYTDELAFNETFQQEVHEGGPNPYYREDILADLDEGAELADWDGRTRGVGTDGKIYIIDQAAMAHVDEDGFDADGNFYPNKDMGEERFFERLDQEMEQDRLECEQIDREDDEELNRTGKLERHEWREEFLDEDGYINDISLLPNSTFLQHNDFVVPEMMVPSPTPLRFRGLRIDPWEVGGATQEWNVFCSVDPSFPTRKNETTVFKHTGTGTMIELPHDSHGWFFMLSNPSAQTYMITQQCSVIQHHGFTETGNDLCQFACDIGDDIEFKVKATHLIAGKWRGMIYGPRIVLWNFEAPGTEIHLTHDGLFIIGDSGRSIQVVANALDEERHNMWFLNTKVALRMIDEKYNKTQASIWQWVKTVDQFSEPCFNKVFKFEEAADPQLEDLTDDEFQKWLKVKGTVGFAHDTYDQVDIKRKMWAQRREAARMRNDNPILPNLSHHRALVDAYNILENITGTPGKGHWNGNEWEEGVWVDHPVFSNIPRYKQILPGVDNEGAEKQHFQHLDILRNLRQQYEVLKEAGVPPDKWMWQYRHLYSRFDMQGIPTHDNHGEPIDVSDRKEKEVELEEHTDAHTEYLEVLEENPDVLERLSYRIAEIQKLVVIYDPYELTVDAETRDLWWATKDIYRGEQFQKDAMFSGAFARRETPRDM